MLTIDTPETLGKLIRDIRKAQGLTQQELAGASGTGVRFIVDLEGGKPSCHVGKALHVLRMLGISLSAASGTES